MKLGEEIYQLKRRLSELKQEHKKKEIIYKQELEELENRIFLLKRKSKIKQMIEMTNSNPNRRKKSEILGISTHGSVPTGISKIKGKKPINTQAARAIGLPTKKKY